MICIRRGTDNKDGTAFCSKCGNALLYNPSGVNSYTPNNYNMTNGQFDTVSNTSKQAKRSNKGIFVIIGAVMLGSG